MQRECNWTSGYKWTTALALSITLGGFGADRQALCGFFFKYIYLDFVMLLSF